MRSGVCSGLLGGLGEDAGDFGVVGLALLAPLGLERDGNVVERLAHAQLVGADELLERGGVGAREGKVAHVEHGRRAVLEELQHLALVADGRAGTWLEAQQLFGRLCEVAETS